MTKIADPIAPAGSDPDVPPSPGAARPGPANSPPPARSRRWRRRRRSSARLNIVSRVMSMLVLTGLVTAGVVGYVGYRSGTQALRNAAFANLRQVRAEKTLEIQRYFAELRDSLVIYTRGSTAIDAVNGFAAGFDALEKRTITPAQRSKLTDYYEHDFVPALDRETDTRTSAAGFLPTDPAQQYLQALYTAPNETADDALAVNDAGDGSAWSAVHARYHDYFRELVTRFRYEDAMLIDPRGTVVYSAYKGVDLGTNLRTGPYRGTKLAGAFSAVLNSNSLDYVGITDYERYQPSLGAPTFWAVSPVGTNGRIAGVLALQLSKATVNAIMTDNRHWDAVGLGRTGESYLVGPDDYMRSTSRAVLQDPQQYEKEVVAAGLAPQQADQAVDDRDSILLQTVDDRAVRSALAGHTGEIETTDYQGRSALMAYGPLDLDGLHWAVIAQIDSSEAFGPVNRFARDMAVATTLLVLLICVAALILAHLFVRPLRRLTSGMQSVTAGTLDIRVEAHHGDEFGELGLAFNDMSSSLLAKQDLIDQQRAENDELLRSLMPDSVAQRYRDGEAPIAEERADVSVLFANLAGFDELTDRVGSVRAVELLGALTQAFDDAAARLGIEKHRTAQAGYLASCGLVVARVDNARRIIDFAQEMAAILGRFDLQHEAELALRIGVDTGPVVNGLVGRTNVVYAMWGDTVNLAHRLQVEQGEPGILVTERVHDRLRQSVSFTAAGEIETSRGRQSVWRLDTPS